MCGNFFTCLLIIFNCADDTFYIVFVYFIRHRGSHSRKRSWSACVPFSSAKRSNCLRSCVFSSDCVKSISYKEPEYKSLFRRQSPEYARVHKFRPSLLLPSVENENIEVLCRFQNINKVMHHTVHLLFLYLSRTYVHILVHLHRIGGDNLSANPLASSMDNFVFPTAVGPVKITKFFFCVILLPFKLLFKFIFRHRNNCRSAMRTVKRIFTREKFFHQNLCFHQGNRLVSFYCCFT